MLSEIRTSYASGLGPAGATSPDAPIPPQLGMLILNADLQPVYCNRAALDLLGINCAPGCIAPEALPICVHEVCSLARQAIPGERHELPGKAGSRRVMLACEAVNLGGFQGFVITIEPEASSLEEREKLLRMDRLASLGTLGAMTAHELKNALVTVKTFIDLLIQKAPESELNELVLREIARMDGLLGSVRQLAGPQGTHFANVNLNDVLTHAFRLLQPQVRAKEARLDQQLAPGPLPVRGRPEQLLQAVLNLLMNALDAGGANSVVTVQAHHATDHVIIAISDTGSGVAPEHLPRIFQPFFSTKPQGTGLGLYITRKIIRDHGGDITVEPAAAGGACFRIRLPLAT